MTFHEVIAELHRIRPDAPVGATARRGKYYDQAMHMDFRPYNQLTYYADGARGKRMWLYVSKAFGKICCGNKDY
jgi:hypothetical protein